MILIADASALIALVSCNGLEFLHTLFSDMYVPRSVYDEVCVEGKPFYAELRDFLPPHCIEVDASAFVITDYSLGRGELDAMALYKQLRANVLLVDDRRARMIAKAHSIEVIGSLGILLLAKEHRLLAEIAPCLQNIKKAGIFISPALLQEALRLAGE